MEGDLGKIIIYMECRVYLVGFTVNWKKIKWATVQASLTWNIAVHC